MKFTNRLEHHVKLDLCGPGDRAIPNSPHWLAGTPVHAANRTCASRHGGSDFLTGPKKKSLGILLKAGRFMRIDQSSAYRWRLRYAAMAIPEPINSGEKRRIRIPRLRASMKFAPEFAAA
jgi:hypothetical protein